jgi:hypothetical protein
MVVERMFLRGAVVLGLAAGVAACTSEAPPTAPLDASVSQSSSGGGSGPFARVRCERRSNRSKISVDGKNLLVRNAFYTARVRSGANTATAPQQQAIGDEVEFDFDSNTGEGGVRIPANFIVVNRTGPDLVGEILRNGAVAVSAAVDCDVR